MPSSFAQTLSLNGTTTPTRVAALRMHRSVPSGRVGNAKDAIFRSNDHFRQAVAEREDCDVAELQHRLDRSLEKAERARIGVGQLRRFLEQLLQRRSVLSMCNSSCWEACERPYLCVDAPMFSVAEAAIQPTGQPMHTATIA